MKITARVKSIKEILNMADGLDDEGDLFFHKNNETYYFRKEMAYRCGDLVDLTRTEDGQKYDYEEIKQGGCFLKEWLTDIKEEIDWSKIPVDTKVLVWDVQTGEKFRRYFKEYRDGKFVAFSDGRTSWSIGGGIGELTSWDFCELAE